MNSCYSPTNDADHGKTDRSGADHDMALLRRYLDDGSQQAFAELVARHYGVVYRRCRRSLGDRDLAADAAQLVFMTLLRRARSLAADVRLSGWLYHTARRVCADLRKQEQRRRRRHELAARAASERYDSLAAADDHDRELRATVREVIALLPATERRAISLRYLEGFTVSELADTLGLSYDGAKKRIARAMMRIRASVVVKPLLLPIFAAIVELLRRPTVAKAVSVIVSVVGATLRSPAHLMKILSNGLRALTDILVANAVGVSVVRVAATSAVVVAAAMIGKKVTSDPQLAPSANTTYATSIPAPSARLAEKVDSHIGPIDIASHPISSASPITGADVTSSLHVVRDTNTRAVPMTDLPTPPATDRAVATVRAVDPFLIPPPVARGEIVRQKPSVAVGAVPGVAPSAIQAAASTALPIDQPLPQHVLVVGREIIAPSSDLPMGIASLAPIPWQAAAMNLNIFGTTSSSLDPAIATFLSLRGSEFNLLRMSGESGGITAVTSGIDESVSQTAVASLVSADQMPETLTLRTIPPTFEGAPIAMLENPLSAAGESMIFGGSAMTYSDVVACFIGDGDPFTAAATADVAPAQVVPEPVGLGMILVLAGSLLRRPRVTGRWRRG